VKAALNVESAVASRYSEAALNRYVTSSRGSARAAVEAALSKAAPAAEQARNRREDIIVLGAFARCKYLGFVSRP